MKQVMIKIYVNKQSNYPVSTPKVKRELKAFFEEKGITSDAEVSVAIVGQARMLKLAKDHLGEKHMVHNVLSFTASEARGKFVNPPGELLYLGEVVVCYPKAVDEANRDNMLIDDKVVQLIKHGALHLLGEHHG